jgi:NADH-quinone oxidoreductase subunit J
VVFLFVVMLLNLGRDDARADLRAPGVRAGAVVVGVLLAAELFVASRTVPEPTAPPPTAPSVAEGTNVVAPAARVLFTEHLVAFEVTSVLLLAAIVGAVALARRESTPAAVEGPRA